MNNQTQSAVEKSALEGNLLPARYQPKTQPLPGVERELIRLLGNDGIVETWLAVEPASGNKSILKFYTRPLDAPIPSAWQDRFRHTVLQLQQLQREAPPASLVRLHSAYLESDPICLEYESLASSDLAVAIQQQGTTGKPLSPPRALLLLLQLTRSLAYFHQLPTPIGHGDLKPTQIYLFKTQATGQDRPKLHFKLAEILIGLLGAELVCTRIQSDTDFAECYRQAMLPRGGFTPLYLSPERRTGAPFDLTDDVYALGVIWFQMLVLDLQAPIPTATELKSVLAERAAQKVPSAQQALLAACTAVERRDRPQHAGELLAALSRLEATVNDTDATSVSVGTQAPPNHLKTSTLPDGDQRSQTTATHLSLHPQFNSQTDTDNTSADPASTTSTTRATSYPNAEAERTLSTEPPPALTAPFDREQANQARQAWADYYGVPATWQNALGMRLILIPPGHFVMGSPETEVGHFDIEQQVPVTLTKPFYLGIYPVTQAEYERLMGTNPCLFASTGANAAEVVDLDTSLFPVEHVNYVTAEEFCRQLTERDRAAQTWPTHWHYTLPTEAQWEYACRAGTLTAYAFGHLLSAQHANFGNPVGHPTPVGSYPSNQFGLFDMHGNVWEWCRDWFVAHLPGGTDPEGTVAETGQRVRRGGGWRVMPQFCRSARRSGEPPDSRDGYLGFRVALVPND